MSFQALASRMQKLLSECEVYLLNETKNDIVCDWRRIRICKNGKYVDVSCTTSYFKYDDEMLTCKILLPITQILNKRKERRMTREEAATKLLNLGYQNSMLCAALEALGLIKFDEEIKAGSRVKMKQGSPIAPGLVLTIEGNFAWVLFHGQYKPQTIEIEQLTLIQ